MRVMSITGSCTWLMRRPSTTMVSACRFNGSSMAGSTSGQLGSSKGLSSDGPRSSVASVMRSASRRSLRPSSGRMSGSR
ncbi:hypothetical protein D3C81_681730 [compost metagenome]